MILEKLYNKKRIAILSDIIESLNIQKQDYI